MPIQQQGQPWLTTAAAAAYTGFSIHTIRDAVQQGELRASRRPTPGGRSPLRFRADDLDRWLDRGRLTHTA